MFNLNVVGALVVGLAIAGSIGLIHGKNERRQGRGEGYDIAVAAVRKQDQRAAEAATAVRSRVEECFDAGKDWDAAAGRCVD